MEPKLGSAMYELSECQSSPKLVGAPASRTISRTSGWSSSPLTIGWRSSSPNRFARATCSPGLSFCPRKKITPNKRNAFQISSTTSSLKWVERSTPEISAPSDAVTGVAEMRRKIDCSVASWTRTWEIGTLISCAKPRARFPDCLVSWGGGTLGADAVENARCKISGFGRSFLALFFLIRFRSEIIANTLWNVVVVDLMLGVGGRF
mmetsp:Transcript_37031/g.68351  ORF Transcript_37031/g.68351 Transcript_37031/m.68351 type:complete len:206 (-) Transcript_37031:163-780(-)